MVNREIDLIDIIYSVLKRWRLFAVLIILGGVFAGAASFVISSSMAKSESASMDRCLERLESESEDGKFSLAELMASYKMDNAYEMEKIRGYAANEKVYYDQIDYVNSSRFMHLNPADITKIQLVYLLSDTKEEVKAADLYSTVLSSVAPLGFVANETGFNENDIRELYELDFERENMANFAVTVFSDDRDECAAIAASMDKYITTELSKLINKSISHSLTKINEFESQGFEREISLRQMEYRNLLKSFNESITKDYSTLSSEGRTYYQFVKSFNGERNNTRADIVYPKGQVQKKYVLLGMIAFSLLFMLLVILYTIVDPKIRKTDNLEKIAGIKVLGNINVSRGSKKKLFGFIDRLIDKIFRNDYERFDQEKTTEFVVSSIKALVNGDNVEEIGLVGCHYEDEIADKLIQKLKENGIKVSAINNIIYNASAADEISKNASYVILEKIGSSSHKELKKELNLLKEIKVSVAGAVLVQEM